MGAFHYHKSIACMDLYVHCNLLTSHSKNHDWVLMFAPLWKRRHCLRYSSFLIVWTVFLRHNWSFNPACKTTGVEDTYITLTAIPLSAYKKKTAEFPPLFLDSLFLNKHHFVTSLLHILYLCVWLSQVQAAERLR